MTTQNISDSEISPAKARRAPSSDNYFLCGLCVLCGKYRIWNDWNLYGEFRLLVFEIPNLFGNFLLKPQPALRLRNFRLN